MEAPPSACENASRVLQPKIVDLSEQAQNFTGTGAIEMEN